MLCPIVYLLNSWILLKVDLDMLRMYTKNFVVNSGSDDIEKLDHLHSPGEEVN